MFSNRYCDYSTPQDVTLPDVTKRSIGRVFRECPKKSKLVDKILRKERKNAATGVVRKNRRG